MAITQYDANTYLIDGVFDDAQVKVATGETLLEGTVLGQTLTTGILERFISTSVLGLENPIAVLAQTVDNSAGVAPVTFDNVRVLLKGRVKKDYLTFSGSETADTIIPLFGKTSLVMKNNGIQVVSGENITVAE